ncbi:MAG: response regulator [Candidatus Stygibacter frigidus]|nr:response regulator [Candidatus Stygibacter frigidus]
MKDYKILIVEDEVLIREMLKEIFMSKFSAVYTAGNGLQGIERYNEFSPDLIITDIKMKKMDGLTMIDKIQQEDPDQKFIIITAYSDEHHLRTAKALGIEDVLVKPIDSRELMMKAIERLQK